MKEERLEKRNRTFRGLILSLFLLILTGAAGVVHAADYSSNLLSQVQPYYTYMAYGRYDEGEASMGGKTYADCIKLDSYNNVDAEAAFYLEGKYKSISFSAGHVNGHNDRTLTVYCDDRPVWSETILKDDLPHNSGIINLTGVQELRFVLSGSSGTFKTAIGNINLVSGGYTREQRMKPVTSNFLANVQAYSSKRYTTANTIVMGDKNFENAVCFDSYNNVEAYATYNLEGKYRDLSFWVGNEKVTSGRQTRTVTITGDGVKLYSRVVGINDAPVQAKISVLGVSQLKIVVSGSSSTYKTVLGGMNLTGKYVDISKASVSVANASYTGKALKPKVTVSYNGTVLKENSDYTVSYSNNTKVGTGKAVITGKGNYTGSVTKTFNIEKGTQNLKVTPASVTLVAGKTKTLSVKGAVGKVTYGTKNKKVATVSQKGKITAKGAGTVKITVKAAGNSNYKAAEKTVEVKVLPKSTKITSAKNNGKGKITVKWSKVSGITGYQIKYVTGTTEKTVSVKKASAKSLSLKNLKKGKTYKIYVRTYKTVSKTNYYSSWSKVKSVKVKK